MDRQGGPSPRQRARIDNGNGVFAGPPLPVGAEEGERQAREEQAMEIEVGVNGGPFVHPPIISNILQYLGTSTVKSCRTLSKEWNKACKRVLNVRSVILIESAADVVNYCRAFAAPIEGISVKVESIQFSHSFFNEIVQRLKEGRGGIASLAGSLHNLAKTTGSQIKSLKVRLLIDVGFWLSTAAASEEAYSILTQIVFHHFNKVEDLEFNVFVRPSVRHATVAPRFQDLVPHPVFSLPKLKNLVIRRGGWGHGNHRIELRSLTELGNRVLQAASNLESLQWELTSTNDFPPELAAGSLSLKSLHFLGTLSPVQLEAMTANNFPNLTSLVCTINWDERDNHIVERFFTRNAEKITDLEADVHFEPVSRRRPINIDNDDDGEDNDSDGDEEVDDEDECEDEEPYYLPARDFVFPPSGVSMPNLRKLTLNKFAGTLIWENIPNLNNLHLDRVAIHPITLHSSTLPENWTLNEFSLSYIPDVRLKEIYLTLKSPECPLWYSNLTRLSLSLGSYLLKVHLPNVFRHCTQLKALITTGPYMHCENEDNLSESITGISTTTQKALKEVYPELGFARNPDDSEETTNDKISRMIEVSKSIHRSLPNIGNLTELQELELIGYISDDAVSLGIILCTKLRKLTLKSPNLSDTTERILKCGLQDLGEVYVIQFR